MENIQEAWGSGSGKPFPQSWVLLNGCLVIGHLLSWQPLYEQANLPARWLFSNYDMVQNYKGAPGPGRVATSVALLNSGKGSWPPLFQEWCLSLVFNRSFSVSRPVLPSPVIVLWENGIATWNPVSISCCAIDFGYAGSHNQPFLQKHLCDLFWNVTLSF